MTSDAPPFWVSNLNPITMFCTSLNSKPKLKYEALRRAGFIETDDLEGYVTAKSLIKELKVNAKRLKSLFGYLGETPRFNKGSSYYTIENVEGVRAIILKKQEIEIDMENYISNRELMSMYNINQYKAWEIAINERLVKYKFTRNVNYYEREKAMIAFSKHQKN